MFSSLKHYSLAGTFYWKSCGYWDNEFTTTYYVLVLLLTFFLAEQRLLPLDPPGTIAQQRTHASYLFKNLVSCDQINFGTRNGCLAHEIIALLLV